MTRTRYGIHKQQTERGVVWKATVDLGPDPATGKRRQRRLSADTRKALEAKIGELLGAAERGDVTVASRLTVREYLEQWFVAIQPSVKPLTVKSYRYSIDGRLGEAIGQYRLDRFGPLQAQSVVAALESYGLKPTTIRFHYGVLRSALRQAIAWGLIQRDPTIGVTLPRVNLTSAAAWDAEQASSFLEAARGSEHYAFWLLAITTGMRRGELVGLTWANVDFDAGLITIDRALVPNLAGRGGGYMESTPKTKRGRRKVGISADVVAELRRHHKRQLERKLRNRLEWRDDSDLVFTDDRGAPLSEYIVKSRFEAAIAAAGLPRIRFHDLRHTAATLMLAAGENPRVVSERLGHANVAITLDRYTHVDHAMQRAAAERLDNLLKRQNTGSS